MLTNKQLFLNKYETLMNSIIPSIQAIPDYQKMFGPHIPGVGDDYWIRDRTPKIAFIGKDVGVGKVIENSLENVDSYVKFSSELMNEVDILEWNLNYGQFGTSIIYLLSKIYNVPIEDLLGQKQNHILRSFVWAESNSVLNFKSALKANSSLRYQKWEELNNACKPLDSLRLLVETTNPDIIILTSWPANKYLDVPSLETIKETYHLRLLKFQNIEKYIIQTCHQRHWPMDIDSDPFYTRLNEITSILMDQINIEKFFT